MQESNLNIMLSKKSMLFISYSYPNARLVQVEIEEITKRDQDKFESDKENKIDKEIGFLRLRQKNEEDALELKISIHLNKFKRERTVKIEEIMLKFKHKGKGLETYQKAEREGYEQLLIKIIKKAKTLVRQNTNQEVCLKNISNVIIIYITILFLLILFIKFKCLNLLIN